MIMGCGSGGGMGGLSEEDQERVRRDVARMEAAQGAQAALAKATEADAVAFEESRDIAGWSERMRNTHLPIYGDDLQPMWSSAVDAWQAIVREHGGDVCMSEAKAIRCPTLVLHGEKDPLCLIEHPHWFNEHITDARMHIFPGGKHNIHQKFADEFNRFVKDVCPAAEYA